MIRQLAAVLLCVLFLAVPVLAADTEFSAEYTPEGPVVAEQEIHVSQNIFVGERFQNGYTLEFDTDLTSPVWHIALVVENRTTQTWEQPYQHATISGFTISTAERDTWLVTNLTGTPSSYDVGKEITLWQMDVKMENDATKESFVTKPVKVESAPVPTAGPLPGTSAPTTTPPTVPATPHTTPQSPFGCCGVGLLACLGTLLILRR